jgi:hypothetical protein
MVGLTKELTLGNTKESNVKMDDDLLDEPLTPKFTRRKMLGPVKKRKKKGTKKKKKIVVSRNHDPRHLNLSGKLPKRTVYMHVLDGCPAYFDGEAIRKITYAEATKAGGRGHKNIVLVDTVEAIRKEQIRHMTTRAEIPVDHIEDMAYIPLSVEVHPILSRRQRVKFEQTYRNMFLNRLENNEGRLPTWREMKSCPTLLLEFLMAGLEQDAIETNRILVERRKKGEPNGNVPNAYTEAVKSRYQDAVQAVKEGRVKSRKYFGGKNATQGSPDNVLELDKG